MGLIYNKQENRILEGYSDASHGNKNDLKFAPSGFIVKLAGGVVTWSSKKITITVCLSSTDAEYISASNTSRELIWIKKNMLQHIGVKLDQINSWINGKPAIQVTKNPVLHSKMKPVGLHYHFVKHQVEKGIINVGYVKTNKQIANIMTKILSREIFVTICDKFMSHIRGEFSLRGTLKEI